MTKLWLIRHGQASFGHSDYDKLSGLGKEQSRILGNYLQTLGTSFDRALSGAILRQTETADIVLENMGNSGKGLTIEKDPAFDEYDYRSIIMALLPGLLEDDPAVNDVLPNIFKDNRSFQFMFGKIMDRWVAGYETPGAESFAQYADRVEKGLVRAYETNGKGTVAIFTSGGVISVAMKLALGLSNQEAMRLGWWVKNTSVTVIRHNKKRFDLLSFNGLSHLELKNDPALLTYR